MTAMERNALWPELADLGPFYGDDDLVQGDDDVKRAASSNLGYDSTVRFEAIRHCLPDRISARTVGLRAKPRIP
jgi:hypothetical protein